MYFNKDITDYQVFTNVQLSMFNLLRYLTDLNDIPLIAYSGRYPFTNSGDIRSVRW